jgi:hypothetical protein
MMTDPTDISEQERADAEALRAALEGDSTPDDHELATFGRFLRHYDDPPTVSKVRNDRLIADALQKVHAVPNRVVVFRRRALVTAAAGFAIAAGLAMFWLQNKPAVDHFAQQRSTAQLFHEAFPASGQTSERIDTIVAARQRDLRENQFTRWGVAP